MGEKIFMSNLVRMTETISVPSKFCNTLDEVPQALKESYDRFAKNRLTEAKAADKDKLVEEVKRLQEKAVGSQTKDVLSKVLDKLSEAGITSGPKIWKFPVARINDSLHPNGNGRVYNRQLWENVIANQRDVICGGVGLADHPQDDADPGQFKNTSIVWLDMMIDDAQKLIYALGSFVGQYGHLAQEILEAGGRIGFSSSGFGELMRDGMTVNPETYQLERVADVVLNPSQSVYGDITDEQPIGNIEYSKQQAITESIVDIPNNRYSESKSQIKKENEMKVDATDNNTEELVLTEEEQKREKIRNVLSEAEVKAFKKYVEQFLEDANDIKNPIDRLQELNNILELVESGEVSGLQEKIEDKLIAERNRLNEMVSQAVAISDEFDTDALTLAENAKKVAAKAAMLEDMNTDLTKKTEALEANMVDYESIVAALTEKVQTLSKTNDETKTQLDEAKLENNKLVVSSSALTEKVENLEKELTEAKSKISALEEESNIAIKEYESKINAIKEESKKAETAALKESIKAKKIDTALKNAIKAKSSLTDSLTTSIKEKDAKIATLTERVKTLAGQALTSTGDSKKIAALADTIDELKKSNSYLENTVNELERANRHLEERNGVLRTKIANIKKSNERTTNDSLAQITEKYNVALGKINALMKENNELKAAKEAAPQSITEAAATPMPTDNKEVEIKHRVKEENTQKIKSAISAQYAGFNFRENKGVEIEAYWQDLVSRYGESILPYESKIRGAKTLREATSNFYMYMTEIDADANKADKAFIQEGLLNPSQRHELLKEAGYDDSKKETDSEANERFKRMMPTGWK